MVHLRSISAALALASVATAHPGEEHTPEQIKREVTARGLAHQKMTRALNSCSSSSAFRARQERAVARRADAARALRQKRDISHKPVALGKRDDDALAKWAAVDHSVDSGYTLDTPLDTLFAGNASCALVEETTIGPYFVAGELIRTDVTEGQAGVPLHLDVQFVDVADCAAVPELVVDIWHCNATGVYSGVSSEGQGGLDSTFARGAQITDADGAAQFDTVFPGHYTGRVTHVHVLGTRDARVLSNETYEGGVATHIGQLFFDPALVSSVEALAPYTSNSQSFTDVLDDSIAAGEATADYDIFVDYAILVYQTSEVIISLINVGIDSSANHTDQATPAAHYYEDGGVDSGLSMGGGGPPPGANGTFPGAGGNSTATGTASGSSSTVVSTSTATADATGTSSGSATSSTATSGASRRLAAPFRFF